MNPDGIDQIRPIGTYIDYSAADVDKMDHPQTAARLWFAHMNCPCVEGWPHWTRIKIERLRVVTADGEVMRNV